MLVDASLHPGPAIFQGIGFIALAIWVVWYVNRPIGKSKPKPEPGDWLYMEPPKNKGAKRKPFWSYANDPGNQPD